MHLVPTIRTPIFPEVKPRGKCHVGLTWYDSGVMNIPRYVFGLVFVVVVTVLFVYLETHGMLPSFKMVQEQRMEIEGFLMRDPVLGVVIFSALYIAAIAFSLPFATPLTVLSGFLFGPVLGTIIVVVSATIGATIIFILARFFFRRFFTRKLGDKLEVVNNEFTNHGFVDVLLLRLAPIVPFALINVATALTSVSFKNYVLATLIGIVPFTFIYVQAGAELARIQRIRDILSLETILTISLIVAVVGLLFVTRHRLEARKRRLLKR